MLHIIHSIFSHIAGFFGTAFVLMLIAALIILIFEMIHYHRRSVNIAVESSSEPNHSAFSSASFVLPDIPPEEEPCEPDNNTDTDIEEA